MIVHITTAKQEYVTELPDCGLQTLIPGPIAIDPKKTCEVYRMIRQSSKGVEQGNQLIPMENPRSDDISRLAFDGDFMVSPVSIARLNPMGPFAQMYLKIMGSRIVLPSMVVSGNNKSLRRQ